MSSIIKPKKKEYQFKIHDTIINDDYHWLRDPSWPEVQDKEVLDYLHQENLHSEKFFENNQDLTEEIYNELVGRIKLSDRTVPIKRKNLKYFMIYEENLEYPKYARIDENGVEEIYFDQNIESQGFNYFRLGVLSVSLCDNILAYTLDTSGDEHFELFTKCLKTGSKKSDHLKNVIGSVIWNSDSTGFFYTMLDDKWRANKVFFHKLGTEQNEDILIYEEKDYTFRVSLGRSTDLKYLFILPSSSDSDEVYTLELASKNFEPKLIIARRKDHLFGIDHFDRFFYLRTNDKGKNFRLVRFENDKDFSSANELFAHDNQEYLVGFYLYDKHIVINKRVLGLPQIMIYDYQLNKLHQVKFEDETYSANVIWSWHDDKAVMISYSSMITPASVLELNFSDFSIRTLKTQEIPSGYDKSLYNLKRLFIRSRDGVTDIPISLVYNKNKFKPDGSNPLYLYGYGSYGMAIEPSFNTNIFSLVDRGFVYCIAHIRGGDDLGFMWYEQAKFLNKKLTFEDFIDCADGLIEKSYTSKGKITIHGGSAGGMLIGVCVNQRPDLYKAAIADVPFVDVLNTMLDDKLPLTPGEFNEWGNPIKNKDIFEYIRSYSPYDNVKSQNYPHMFVLAGLNDPRVTYWEPAKWVSKIRDLKTDGNILIFETEMEAGHGGKTGRFKKYKEISKKYSFIISVNKIDN